MTPPPYPNAETVAADDPRFPLRITKRAKRRLAAHIANRNPYAGSCLLFRYAHAGVSPVWYCDDDEIRKYECIVTKFGRTNVACPVDAVDDFENAVIDLRTFPPGPENLYVKTDPSNLPVQPRQARVAISIDQLRKIQPELLKPASTFTKIARGILSVTRLFAHTDGSPGWMGRLVGEDDPDGQAEAIEIIAEQLWFNNYEPAVVVSTSPMVVSVFLTPFDHVALLRFRNDTNWSPGQKLIAVPSYGLFPKPSVDYQFGPNATGEWNEAWPLIADLLTDDTVRLSEIRNLISTDLWNRTEKLGQERLQAGHPRRDGRPWLSRVSTTDQGRGFWKQKGGYWK